MDIKVGKTSFNKEYLKSIKTLKEAYLSFPSFDKRVVEEAWKRVHPKRKKKSPKISED